MGNFVDTVLWIDTAYVVRVMNKYDYGVKQQKISIDECFKYAASKIWNSLARTDSEKGHVSYATHV